MATTEPQQDFLDAIATDPDMAPENAAFWTQAAARDYLRRAEAAEQELAQLKDDLGSERYHSNGKEASPIVLRALTRCREQRDDYLRRAEVAEARLAAVEAACDALSDAADAGQRNEALIFAEGLRAVVSRVRAALTEGASE